MGDGKSEGYFLSYKTLGAIGTLIAILVALGGSVTQVNSWEYRINSLETTSEKFEQSTVGLTQEIKNLGIKITDLTLTLREVQIKQDLGTKE